jgi:two-component system, response regulator YesN
MRVFKRHTGQTVVQFINHLRIEEAKRRLANDSGSITQLALESGFESVPYFNRVFRRVVGMSPREFRKR